MSREIAIIGAGIAGTTAALRLADAGRDVTLIDPHMNTKDPPQRKNRKTIPTSLRSVINNLRLPIERYPAITHARLAETGWERRPISDGESLSCIDALSARRFLLQQAKQHGGIELVEGKAVSLQVEETKLERVATGVKLDDDSVIETGKHGLIVVATGRDTRLLAGGLAVERSLESRTDRRVLGAYITSPALRQLPRDTMEQWRQPFAGTIIPAEQLEEGGTDFATIFVLRGDQRIVYDHAVRDQTNMLATMQTMAGYTHWRSYFLGAKIDRILYHRFAGNVIRWPAEGGVVFVGDTRASLDPGLKKGLVRIDEDTACLQSLVADKRDLAVVAKEYNKLPIVA